MRWIRYVAGHHRQAMTRHVDEANAAGYLTVHQVCARLGLGRTLVRACINRGLVTPDRMAWGGRSIQVIAVADLDRVRDAITGRTDGRKRAHGGA